MSVTRRELIAAVAAATVATSVRAEEPAAATSPEAEARIAWTLGRWGDRFDEAQKNDIRRNIRSAQSGFDAMRAYPLDNAVEPATIFRVHRAESRTRHEKA